MARLSAHLVSQTKAALEHFCWNCNQSHVALQYLQVLSFCICYLFTHRTNTVFFSIMSVVFTPAATRWAKFGHLVQHTKSLSHRLQVPMFAGLPLGETIEPPSGGPDGLTLPAGTRCTQISLCFVLSTAFCRMCRIMNQPVVLQHLACSPRGWVQSMIFRFICNLFSQRQKVLNSTCR